MKHCRWQINSDVHKLHEGIKALAAELKERTTVSQTVLQVISYHELSVITKILLLCRLPIHLSH
jgi:hypothetical protein